MPVSRKNWLLISTLAYTTIVAVFVLSFVLFVNAVDPLPAALYSAGIAVASGTGIFIMVTTLFKLFLTGNILDIGRITDTAEAYVMGTRETGDLRDEGVSFPRLRAAVYSLGSELRQLRSAMSADVEHRVKNIRGEEALLLAQNYVLLQTRKELEKFHLAVAEAPVHIIITDSNGVILYANRAAEKITGYTVTEMIGSKPSLWGGLMPPEYYRTLWKTISEDREVFTSEVRNRRKDGRIYPAEIRIRPILDDRNMPQFYVGIEQDISGIKEMNKLKTEFIALASHQLRSPLSSVRWTTESLKDSIKTGTEMTHVSAQLDKIYESTLQMSAIIRDLLDVTRFELDKVSIQYAQTDMKPVVEEITKKITNHYNDKSVTAETNWDGDTVIETDAGLAGQIIENLISNAVKYSHDGGSVRIQGATNGDAFVIAVTDEGIGISEDDKPRIFDRFFRGINAQTMTPEGTGLGLYLAKRIANSLGGDIAFESSETSGSTFRLTLPKHPGKNIQNAGHTV